MPVAASLCEERSDRRLYQARLELVFDSLPSAYRYNIAGVLVFGVALVAGGPITGNLPWRAVAAACLIQAIGSLAAWLMYRRRQKAMTVPETAERQLLLLQFLLATGWGLIPWCYWVDGAYANNAAIGMALFVNSWSTTHLRAAHHGMLRIGILMPALMMTLLFSISPGVVAHFFLIGAPLWTIYILFVGAGSHQAVGEALRLRFEHADMAEELFLARNHALAREREAQAANAAKSAFIANMSHELRTPLNVINGFSEMIARRSLGDSAIEQYSGYAQDIFNSGRHLLSLVNDLLDVAKIEAGKMQIEPQPLNVAAEIADVLHMMQIRFEAKKQQVTCHCAEDLPPLQADARAFRQIFLNLLSNANKYTADGGHIHVSCQRADDAALQFCIADDGIGIAPDKIEGLFTLFATMDNRYSRTSGGTGLGLALVRGLIELHAGRVWAESAPDVGTRMYLYWPLTFEANSGKKVCELNR